MPPANLAGSRAAPRAGQQILRVAERRHLIVQFESAVTRQDLADLRRAGATPLRYVPEHAMAVSADANFDPASLPRARWSGTLAPTDKLSAGTAADLERPFPAYPLTVIEFQPDVTAVQAAARIAEAGTSSVPGASLPAHIVMVPTDRTAIERLAADSAVAWIYPATSDLSGGGARLCQGIVGPEGIVAEYAATGEGWDGPGHGTAPDLRYFVSSTSPDLSASLTHGEIGRALAEWSRVIDVTFTSANGPYDSRSLTILWGPQNHGDGFPFEGQVLAHAFYPAPLTSESVAGDIHFNDGVDWGASDASRYDVFSIMLHETGHSLGLTHSSDPDAVMYPIYRGIVSSLTATDVAAARLLYSAPSTPLSGGWTSDAIGNVGGGVTADGGRFRIEAAGRDVWSTSDELRLVSRTLDGDGDIIARLDSLAGVHSWSKAGVMIRASADAGAPHAFMLVSAAKGIAFQRRRTADGITTGSAALPGTAPRWLWLSRRGDRFEAFSSVDGGTWTLVGSDTIPMGRRVLAGLALTSHDPYASAAAEFSNVSLTTPGRWSNADIGHVASAGDLLVSGTQMRVSGAGLDVWGNADAFHYAWQPLAGDGEIVARVASVQNTARWAKAGVMIRAGTGAGAAHAFMLVSPGKGYAFQRRTSDGGLSTHTSGGTGTAPQWVRLRRTGNTLTASRSADGVTWTTVGSDTIAMGTDVLIGLAVSSHTTSVCETVFDNVTIR